MPSSTAPTSSFLRSSAASPARSSSSSARRERIAFPPRISITRNLSFWPTNCAGSSTKRTSICEAGQKARSPPRSTSSPPLFCAVTVPSTGTFDSSACCSTSRPAPLGTDRVITGVPSVSEST